MFTMGPLHFPCRVGLSLRVVKFGTLPSFTMPTLRHFWKRQYWQRLRLLLSTGQFLLAKQTYLAFFCTVLYRETVMVEK